MRYTLLTVAVLVVLTGCGTQGAVTPLPESPQKKNGVAEERSVADLNDIVVYEIPELGIAFDIEKQYAEDLIYEYSNRNSEGVAFDSTTIEERFSCGLGYSGAVSKFPVENGCLNDRKPEVITENYAFCFSGPQAVCTDDQENERGEGIASVDVVFRALLKIREL